MWQENQRRAPPFNDAAAACHPSSYVRYGLTAVPSAYVVFLVISSSRVASFLRCLPHTPTLHRCLEIRPARYPQVIPTWLNSNLSLSLLQLPVTRRLQSVHCSFYAVAADALQKKSGYGHAWSYLLMCHEVGADPRLDGWDTPSCLEIPRGFRIPVTWIDRSGYRKDRTEWRVPVLLLSSHLPADMVQQSALPYSVIAVNVAG